MQRNPSLIRWLCALSVITAAHCVLPSTPASAQVVPAPSLMSFSGRLTKPDGTPVADGNYSLRFSLWDAVSGGTEKWNQTFGSVSVKSGSFAVALNVASPATLFNNDNYLEIKIGSDAPLTPRQQLLSVAYAMKANSVPDGSIGAAQLANGAITADKFAAGTLNNLGWLLGGNSGTNPASHFLGTTDNQPLIFRTNNTEKVRLGVNGNLGIGTTGNSYKLSLFGGGLASTAGSTLPLTSLYGQALNASGVAQNSVFLNTFLSRPVDGADWTTAPIVIQRVTDVTSQALLSFHRDNIGIGTTQPTQRLEVAGTARMTGFQLPTGAAAGRTLISDASGNGTWGQISASGIADGTITSSKLASGTLNTVGWLLGGNSGTNPASQFLGTTDNQALNFRVNNRRAMRYQYAETITNIRSINVLGGADINTIANGVVGATIAGGGYDHFTDTDYPNRVLELFGTVGGGAGNTASGVYSTVGGGSRNTASWSNDTVSGGIANTASGGNATVGGGNTNSASGYESTVGGGRQNNAANQSATIGGGYSNTAAGNSATVGGGGGNTASNDFAMVGGGGGNTASGFAATIGGGDTNTASGFAATVAGGRSNTASGQFSFAAGRRAQAIHFGALVWADGTDADFASTVANQFNVRASGGARIFSNFGATTGVLLAAGGGSWSSASDKNLKTNFQAVDVLDVLEKLTMLPLTTWNYKANMDIRHIGVMAQDFYAAFGGLGVDDRHIDTVDADGVAFAAIQGLNRKLEAKDKRLQAEVTGLKGENAAIRAENAELKARLEALEVAVQRLTTQQK